MQAYNKEHLKDKTIHYKLKYAFKEPNLFTSVQNIHLAMKDDDKFCYELVQALKQINPAISDNSFTSISKAAARIAAKRLLGKVFQIRREKISSLI